MVYLKSPFVHEYSMTFLEEYYWCRSMNFLCLPPESHVVEMNLVLLNTVVRRIKSSPFSLSSLATQPAYLIRSSGQKCSYLISCGH